MRIAFAGSGRLGTELLRALLASHHEVVAVVQNGRTTKGTKRRLTAGLSSLLGAKTSVLGMAQKRQLPILWIDKMAEDELAPLRALNPDLLLVGGFGIILKAPLLRLPRIGCLNTHSALLPRHRGPNPFTAVILQNESETGVTFHIMDEGIDTGDIVEQVRCPIQPHDTAGTIYRTTSKLAGQHVVAVLDRVERDGLTGTPQDVSLATYDKKLDKADACIDWSQPAEEIDRLVRACSPFLLARFRRKNSMVYVMAGRPDSTDAAAPPGTVLQNQPVVKIATGQGTYSVLQAYSRTPLPWLWPAPWTRPTAGERLE